MVGLIHNVALVQYDFSHFDLPSYSRHVVILGGLIVVPNTHRYYFTLVWLPSELVDEAVGGGDDNITGDDGASTEVRIIYSKDGEAHQPRVFEGRDDSQASDDALTVGLPAGTLTWRGMSFCS